MIRFYFIAHDYNTGLILTHALCVACCLISLVSSHRQWQANTYAWHCTHHIHPLPLPPPTHPPSHTNMQAGTVFSLEHIEGGSLRHGLLVYWISKFIELLDTVYMVLRHKTRQISFLHVWHHSTITLLADWAYTRSSIPAIVPIVALNSAVHVVMYGYYALTALFPLHEFTWKKRITQMQMTQFLIAIVHGTYGYLYHGFCIYSILYGLGMLSLFSNFYYRAFIVKKKPRADTEKVAASGSDGCGNSVRAETAKIKWLQVYSNNIIDGVQCVSLCGLVLTHLIASCI